jgi:hypothetical protein
MQPIKGKGAIMRKIVLLTACAALIGAAPALAADLGAEITTAHTHAMLAANASGIGGVHTHLHHVLNCLVGPQGNGFDAKELNPCAQSGAGAIPDSASNPAAQKALKAAAVTARAGIAETDIASAKAAATKAAKQIMAAK